jgi:hypothetical protein
MRERNAIYETGEDGTPGRGEDKTTTPPTMDDRRSTTPLRGPLDEREGIEDRERE